MKPHFYLPIINDIEVSLFSPFPMLLRPKRDIGVLNGKQYERCIAYERYQLKNAYYGRNRVSDSRSGIPSDIFSCSRHGLLVLRLDFPDFILQLLFWHYSADVQAQSRIDKGTHDRVQT
jgi:hypothetical protein